jgi:hypothetical protein
MLSMMGIKIDGKQLTEAVEPVVVLFGLDEKDVKGRCPLIKARSWPVAIRSITYAVC